MYAIYPFPSEISWADTAETGMGQRCIANIVALTMPSRGKVIWRLMKSAAVRRLTGLKAAIVRFGRRGTGHQEQRETGGHQGAILQEQRENLDRHTQTTLDDTHHTNTSQPTIRRHQTEITWLLHRHSHSKEIQLIKTLSEQHPPPERQQHSKLLTEHQQSIPQIKPHSEHHTLRQQLWVLQHLPTHLLQHPLLLQLNWHPLQSHRSWNLCSHPHSVMTKHHSVNLVMIRVYSMTCRRPLCSK